MKLKNIIKISITFFLISIFIVPSVNSIGNNSQNFLQTEGEEDAIDISEYDITLFIGILINCETVENFQESGKTVLNGDGLFGIFLHKEEGKLLPRFKRVGQQSWIIPIDILSEDISGPLGTIHYVFIS